MDNKLEKEAVLEDAAPNNSTAPSEEDAAKNTASGKAKAPSKSKLSTSGAPTEQTISNDEHNPTPEQIVSNDENSAKPEKKNESLEFKLRKFKRQSSGIVAEVRRREAYDKPSVKRQKKSKAARRRKNQRA